MATLSLTGRALRLLSTREHSRAELERKLAQYEEEPGALARALDTLAAKDFINETRVVESVLHRRSAKLGTQRIKQELQSKGLEPEAVANRPGCIACNRTGPRAGSLEKEVRHAPTRRQRARQTDALSGQPRFRRRRHPQSRVRW